jgi:membrane protein required for colicin V production
MNAVDIVILVIVVAAVITGLRRGFIVQVAAMLGAVVALGVAKLEYADVRHLLLQVVSKSPWITVISYLLIFFVVWGAILVVARKIRSIARFLLLGWLDRLLGAVLGLLQALLVIELLLYLGKRVPNGALHHAVNHARLTPAFLHALPYISHWFPHVPH